MIMIQYCLGKVLMSKITDICYFHGREVGLPTVVCHDVVSLVIYYFHGREVGLPTVVCHDVVSLVIYIISTVVRSDYRRWYATMS